MKYYNLGVACNMWVHDIDIKEREVPALHGEVGHGVQVTAVSFVCVVMQGCHASFMMVQMFVLRPAPLLVVFGAH